MRQRPLFKATELGEDWKGSGAASTLECPQRWIQKYLFGNRFGLLD
jgi:hypothetical protein